MIRRPPEHAADAVPLYIASIDDALDNDRIKRERKALAKGEEHCVDRYYEGTTRYDLDAPHTVGGSVVTMRGYIRDGGTPTVFKLRRVSSMIRDQVSAVAEDRAAFVAGLYKLARHGVTEIADGFEGPAWPLEGGSGGLPLTEADMQTLYDADQSLPQHVGLAVLNASRSLSDDEKNL
jgi:hypothetical protein